MELKNNQLFRAMEWLTSTVEGCSQAVCVLGESCSLDLFSKSALSSKGWRKVNPKGKFHGWGRSQKLRKRRKTGWKGYCLWGTVVPCCEEAPCDFQSRGEKGNLLKKIKRKNLDTKMQVCGFLQPLWNRTWPVPLLTPLGSSRIF